jgi:hypothetical protein
MSVIDLRREFRKLQEEFLGGAISKLKKHEVEHRMAALKSAMELKANTPAPAPASAGAPGAREVKSAEVSIDGETKLIKPVAPKGGMKHATSYKKGSAKKDDKKPGVKEIKSGKLASSWSEDAAKKRALAKASGQEVHVISAATRQGVDGVLDALIMLAGRDLGAVKSEGRAWTPL